MVLTSRDIESRGIVENAQSSGRRSTSYDATVGCIILSGKEIDSNSFKLQPRGVVWVISSERFLIPDDCTGLATLRTTWTHDGLLTLNVGIVDPGWHGPLAAAVVNFSRDEFEIKKGDGFLRVMIHEHEKTGVKTIEKTMDGYKKEIVGKSRMYSSTFLNMDTLVAEVSDKVFTLPRWAQMLAMWGFGAAVLAIFVPIAISVSTDYYTGPAKFEHLQKQIDELKPDEHSRVKINTIEERIKALEIAGQPLPKSNNISPADSATSNASNRQGPGLQRQEVQSPSQDRP